MARKEKVKAIAYLRTSSHRMSAATRTPTSASGQLSRRSPRLVALSWSTSITTPPCPVPTLSRSGPDVAALLDRIEGNGVRTVIVEDASRFARELVTQELGILALIKRGVRVITANGDDLTDSADPSRKMMRQIAGSFAEYEKARLVAKLKAARDRKIANGESAAVAALMPSCARKWWRSPSSSAVHARRAGAVAPAGVRRAGGARSPHEAGRPFSAVSVSNMLGE